MDKIKVFLFPDFNPVEKGEGGIRRVWEAQRKYLPAMGVEFVSDIRKADVVNIHADEIKTNLPVVFSSHGLYWSGHEWPTWAYRANEKLIRVSKRANTKAITVPSQWVANSFRRGMMLDPFVIPHGITLKEWEPKESLGYVLWAKNRADSICDPSHMDYLSLKFPNLSFITTFGENRPNVDVLGRIPFKDMKNFIQRAGVYLANVEETGGITVLEAMACAVPILASKKGVNLELVTHGEDGYLYDPDSQEDLENGLLYCLQNRDRLGAAARQTVIDQYQWKDTVGGYIDAYKAALGVNGGPKVSVIITAYNLEKYLPASIESVINQDFDDWELIIVDDNSPDHCGEIADDYAKRDNRIKVIHNPQNVYLAEARNIGIRNSSGDFIFPLDADDKMAPGAMRVLAKGLDDDPDTHITTGAMALVEPDGKEWVSTWPWDEPDYGHQIAHKNQVPYASMYRREAWSRTGGYRRRMRSAEDADFWTRVMSFGALPVKVTAKPTLIYTNRPDSMSHTEVEPDWTAWFSWSKFPHMTPYGNSGRYAEGYKNVHKYGPAQISVIIPVGPGHDIFLQDSLDSLVAQTFLNWEVILINDTGRRWIEDEKIINPYLQGFPFARIIDSDQQVGTGSARNKGIQAAKSDLITFLDADDYLQPMALDLLYKTYHTFGGWVYVDWYDQEGTYKKKEAREWSGHNLLKKAIGPITGIFAKKDLELIGGFDEDIYGWEDWDLHLNLFNHGICGTRLPIPLLTYRYDTGINRDRDFSQRENLVQYIQAKYKELFRKEDHFMGCQSCPGKGGKVDLAVGGVTAEISNSSSEELVELAYTGSQKQKRRLKSKVTPRKEYTYGGNKRRFFVLEGDVGWLSSMTDFEKVSMSPTPSAINTNVGMPQLRAERTPYPPSLTFDSLNLPEGVLTILKRHYTTVQELNNISVARLITIKGIGSKRAEEIKNAVDELFAR